MPRPKDTTLSATDQREAARRNRRKAFAARNELIAVLARLWPSHLMPIQKQSVLATVLDAEHSPRMTVCIHHPTVGILWWMVTPEEVETYFSWMPRERTSHWDRSSTAERSERLKRITADGSTGTPTPPHDPTLRTKGGAPRRRAKTTKTIAPTPEPVSPRRPGDFSRRH